MTFNATETHVLLFEKFPAGTYYHARSYNESFSVDNNCSYYSGINVRFNITVPKH